MAFATDPTVQEGRSVGKACSPSVVVCAISKDGSMKEIDECGARGDRTSRILSGACFDPD